MNEILFHILSLSLSLLVFSHFIRTVTLPLTVTISLPVTCTHSHSTTLSLPRSLSHPYSLSLSNFVTQSNIAYSTNLSSIALTFSLVHFSNLLCRSLSVCKCFNLLSPAPSETSSPFLPLTHSRHQSENVSFSFLISRWCGDGQNPRMVSAEAQNLTIDKGRGTCDPPHQGPL